MNLFEENRKLEEQLKKKRVTTIDVRKEYVEISEVLKLIASDKEKYGGDELVKLGDVPITTSDAIIEDIKDLKQDTQLSHLLGEPVNKVETVEQVTDVHEHTVVEEPFNPLQNEEVIQHQVSIVPDHLKEDEERLNVSTSGTSTSTTGGTSHTRGMQELDNFASKAFLVKHFFTRKALVLSALIFVLLNLDLIAPLFHYTFNWSEKFYNLLKIAFVLPIAYSTVKTLNKAFEDFDNHSESGVPSPRTVIYYISQSWLLYILLGTGLTVYNFNLESIGIENLSDFVATINAMLTLLAITQFLVWRWFRKFYEFLFSTVDDMYDSNSTWMTLPAHIKTYVSLSLFLIILWITSNVFMSYLAR